MREEALSPRPGLSANQLRLLAVGLMLLDHLWATGVFGANSDWMTFLGRLAFPIFAFQISEGFFHTADRKRYTLRLFLFALLSEVPFNLMYAASPVYPFHQNALFTLLLGLLAVCALDRALRKKTDGAAVLGAAQALGCLLAGAVGMVDYGWRGVATVVAFYALRDFPGAKAAQAAALILLNIVGFEGYTILLFGREFQTQGFAVLALLPIWLYNGRRGGGGWALQYAFYAFYPVHMLILYLVFFLFW